MKRIPLLLILMFIHNLESNAQMITSTAGGGAWNVNGTWVGGAAPTSIENATIAGTVTITDTTSINTVTINSSKSLIINTGQTISASGPITNSGTLTINSGAVVNGSITNNATTSNLIISGSVTINGSIVNTSGTVTLNSGAILTITGSITNKSTVTGAGNIVLTGTGNVIQGNAAGHWTGHTGTITFSNSPQVIGSSVALSKGTGNLILNNVSSAIYVTNNAKVTLTGSNAIVDGGGTNQATWVCGANTTTEISAASLQNGYDSIKANAAGCVVEYGGSGSYNINEPELNQFNELEISGSGTKTQICALNILSTLLVSSGTFNMSGYSDSIGGNWTNNGTIVNNTGSVYFYDPSVSNIISGTSVTTFNNISVLYNELDFDVNTMITGVLTLNAGVTLGGTDTLTMVSTSSGTARMSADTFPTIGDPTGATSQLVVTIQRYDSRTKANYQMLSSPIGGDASTEGTMSSTLADWNDNNGFYISGVNGPNGNAQNNSGGVFYSAYTFDETSNSYQTITTESQPINQGMGTILFMGTSAKGMTPFTYNTHGLPNTDEIDAAVTDNSDGYNVIGNPYASPISWIQFASDNSGNLAQTSYCYVTGQDGNYHEHNNVLAMEQGFMVVVNGNSSTVAFLEDQKSNTDTALFMPYTPSKTVTFILSDDANLFSCHTSIVISSAYSKNYNPAEDAVFIDGFVSSAPSLYTISEDKKNLMMNKLPDVDSELIVPLTAIGHIAANYTLTPQGINSLQEYNCVMLADKATGQLLANFEDNPSYTFNLAQADEQRDFVLIFKKLAKNKTCTSLIGAGSTGNESISIYPSQSGAVAMFHVSEPENAFISVYNLLGQKITEINSAVYDSQVDINLESGQIYIIRIVTAKGITVKKIFH